MLKKANIQWSAKQLTKSIEKGLDALLEGGANNEKC
jgi:hypothetical protein